MPLIRRPLAAKPSDSNFKPCSSLMWDSLKKIELSFLVIRKALSNSLLEFSNFPFFHKESASLIILCTEGFEALIFWISDFKKLLSFNRRSTELVNSFSSLMDTPSAFLEILEHEVIQNKKVLIISLDFNELIREIEIMISSPLKYLDLLGKLVEAEVILFSPYNRNFSRILV